MITVVGQFDSPADAHSAIQELLDNGWTHESVSIIAGPVEESRGAANMAVKEAEKGAMVGGLAGLLLGIGEFAVPGFGLVLIGGWLAAAVLGAGVGAAAGGLIGLLVEAGISHEQAAPLAESVRQGGAVVVVKTEESRIPQATGILQQHHARDIHQRAG